MSDDSRAHLFDPTLIPCDEISDRQAIPPRPLASVKTTTYNQAAYIAQTIEGVVRQETTFPVEYVIGEDCSTDATRKIVLEYQKKYPRLIRVVTADRNVGAVRNGLRVDYACRGKYIAYCEGDDFWQHPKKLQMQVDFLEARPDYGLVHTDADWLVDRTGEVISSWHKRHHTVTQGDIYQDLLLVNHVMTCTVCARKDLLDQIGRNRDVWSQGFPFGDYPRWLMIAMASKIGYLDVSTATRRECLGSFSVSLDVSKNYAFLLAVQKIKEYFMQLQPPSPSIQQQVRRDFNQRKLRFAYLLQDSQIAREAHDYLAGHGRMSVTDRLHFWGSRGKGRHAAAEAMLRAKNFVQQRRNRRA
jgi:glycosyltransferase involved in cell wall biosynthesis